MPELVGKTIGELPLGGPLVGADMVEIQTSAGVSVRVTLSDLASYLLASTAIIPANLPWRGARASLDAAMSATAPTLVAFNKEDIDTDGIWSFAQPTKLIVPAGVTKVRLTAKIEGQTTTGSFSLGLLLYKNNVEAARFVGQRHASITGGNSANVGSFTSGVLSVVAGDEFEIYAEGSYTSIAAGSFFEMEIVEYTA